MWLKWFIIDSQLISTFQALCQLDLMRPMLSIMFLSLWVSFRFACGQRKGPTRNPNLATQMTRKSFKSLLSVDCFLTSNN